MSVAEQLVRQFDRMVRRDGGSLALVAVEGSCIIVAYEPGVASECAADVCVMPHQELQALMSETLARRDPEMSVRVVRAQDQSH
jgi:hypothetical protein